MAVLCSNAQIRDTFFGFKLGITTKAQVLAKFKSQGEIYKYDSENKFYFVENVSFAGEKWDSCSFEFYKDTLDMVGFSNISADKNSICKIYERNLNNVRIKYNSVEEDTLSDDSNKKHYSYDDGRTIMSICYEQLNDLQYHTSIIYQSRLQIVKRKYDYMDDL